MKLLEIQIKLKVKGDTDDPETLEADIREELQGLLESDEALEYEVLNDEDEEEEEELDE